MAHWSEDKNDPRWKIVQEICWDFHFVNDNDDLVQKFHETKDPVYWDRMMTVTKPERRQPTNNKVPASGASLFPPVRTFSCCLSIRPGLTL